MHSISRQLLSLLIALLFPIGILALGAVHPKGFFHCKFSESSTSKHEIVKTLSPGHKVRVCIRSEEISSSNACQSPLCPNMNSTALCKGSMAWSSLALSPDGFD
jgi:hypothetical protein